MKIEILIGIATLIVAIIGLFSEENKRRFFFYLKRTLHHLVIWPIYWFNSRKFRYGTKVYLGESEQANERAYVYVGKKRIFRQDIPRALSRWIQATLTRLRRLEPIPPKAVPANELGVIQTLAVYRVHRGARPDSLDERFWELDEQFLPMHTWEAFDECHKGSIEYEERYTLLGYRFQLGGRQYYDGLADREKRDWDAEVISLFSHSPRLDQDVKSALREFKKKHNFKLKCIRDLWAPSKSKAKWEHIKED